MSQQRNELLLPGPAHTPRLSPLGLRSFGMEAEAGMSKKNSIPETFKWPARGRLVFYRRRTVFLFSASDRMYDLSDGLMVFWPHTSRTVYMGVSTKSPHWRQWNEENLKKIESLIRYDLNFDGYRVHIMRLTRGKPMCSEEFLWKLQICLRESRRALQRFRGLSLLDACEGLPDPSSATSGAEFPFRRVWQPSS